MKRLAGASLTVLAGCGGDGLRRVRARLELTWNASPVGSLRRGPGENDV